MEEILLAFEQVTGTKGKFRLQNISFALPAGYIMGLMGVNGAGKTTLMNYIMNEKSAYTGTIKIAGQDMKQDDGKLKNIIGLVSEENRFLNERTAAQNVEILSGFYEDFDKEIFRSAMETMGVSGNLTYGKMSRGERLKFQMAFAMAHHARLYLLDEVTVGMDPVFRMDFFRLLQRIIRDGQCSVLMTSHIESEMEQKTDYVGILEQGNLVHFGESMDIIPRLKGEREADENEAQ